MGEFFDSRTAAHVLRFARHGLVSGFVANVYLVLAIEGRIVGLRYMKNRIAIMGTLRD